MAGLVLGLGGPRFTVRVWRPTPAPRPQCGKIYENNRHLSWLGHDIKGLGKNCTVTGMLRFWKMSWLRNLRWRLEKGWEFSFGVLRGGLGERTCSSGRNWLIQSKELGLGVEQSKLGHERKNFGFVCYTVGDEWIGMRGVSSTWISYSYTTVYCGIHERSECSTVDSGLTLTNLIHDQLDVSTQAWTSQAWTGLG